MKIIDIIGWVGMTLVLSGYFLISAGIFKLKYDSISYDCDYRVFSFNYFKFL